MNKSKILSIVLAILLVASLALNVVTLGQKGSLQNEKNELLEENVKLSNELNRAEAAVEAAEEAAAAAAANAGTTTTDDTAESSGDAASSGEAADSTGEAAVTEEPAVTDDAAESSGDAAESTGEPAQTTETAELVQPELNPHVKSIIEVDGYQFIDLNANGTLDVYEDWRQDDETRAADLVSQMTLREKIAQMQHPTFLPRSDGKIPSYLEKWCNREGIGMLLIRELNSVEAAATSMNTIQEYAEGSRLGVPVLVSMDSVHGLSYVNGATVTPHNLALAATGDVELVTKLAEIAREEHIAIGVRMTLSPEADIATEPRWGRVMETFGENPDVVTEMVKAQIVAFQNGADGVNEGGIVACIKHFPGAGPQLEGKDTSPIVSSEESLQVHLQPYYAALEVNVGSVMPYYSVPLTLDMENSAIGSKATLQDLLREQMGFEGIIQTDWGMIWAIQEGRGTMTGEEISDEEAILIGITESRVDGIGGESINLITQMEELVNAGKIDEAIIDAAATRIVLAKFQLGVFENPYCDVEYALEFVGNEEHTAVNLEAARKAMTLLENDGTLPLAQNSGLNILVCGPRGNDMMSLVGGWSSEQEGLTIYEAIAEYAGENCTVNFIADDVTAIAEAAKTADVVIVSIGEPSYQHDPPWGYDTLEITATQQEILETVKANTTAPIITVVTGGRPYILTWCAENTNAILMAYYPGQQGGIAIAETLFGLNNPTGKTPIQFPRDMESVNNQSSDIAFDLENPLYDYGYGLSYTND